MSSFLRPEAKAALHRWREVIAGTIALAIAALLFTQIGYVQQGLGLILGAASLGYIILALRRMKFAGSADAPGIVTLDEGQIAYFAPDFGLNFGGTVDIAELTELRLRNDKGRLSWFLMTQTHALAIPHDAAGADLLFDSFSALPNLTPTTLLRAVSATQPGTITVWRAATAPGLTALR